MGAHLSEPVTIKENEEQKIDNLRVAVTGMQGWRNTMEDSHCINCNISKKGAHLFGVFDGHGGQEVALYAARHLAPTLEQLPEFKKGNYKEAMRKSFLALDDQLRSAEGRSFMNANKNTDPPVISDEIKMIEQQMGVKVGNLLQRPQEVEADAKNAGCTAVAVLIIDGKYYVANAGDSRASVCRGGATIELTRDHNPECEIEIARITKAGGTIERGRVNGNLNLTRAVGDLCYKDDDKIPAEAQIISAEPDVSISDVHTDDEFLLLACDGIWEARTTTQVQNFVKRRLDDLGNKPLASVGNDLCDALLSPSVTLTEGIGCDNMTVMLIDLMPHKRDASGKPPKPSSDVHKAVQLNAAVGKDGSPIAENDFPGAAEFAPIQAGGA